MEKADLQQAAHRSSDYFAFQDSTIPGMRLTPRLEMIASIASSAGPRFNSMQLGIAFNTLPI